MKIGIFSSRDWQEQKIFIHSLTKIQKYDYLDGAIKVHKFFEQCFFSQFEMVNVVHIFNFTSFFTEVTDFSLKLPDGKANKTYNSHADLQTEKEGVRERNSEKMGSISKSLSTKSLRHKIP